MTTHRQPISPEVSQASREFAREFSGIDRVPTVAAHRQELRDLEAGLNADLGVQPIPTPEAPVALLQRPGVKRAARVALATAGVGLLAAAGNYLFTHDATYGDRRELRDPQEQPAHK
jgi:hypothetical protein